MNIISDKEREILIARMVDAPKGLTDDDIRLIERDEELKGIYEAVVLCKAACSIGNAKIPDVGNELDKFKKSYILAGRVKLSRFILRIAAVFMCCLSVVAIASYRQDLFGFKEEMLVVENDMGKKEKTEIQAHMAAVLVIANEKELIYDNIRLDSIMTELADIYKVNVVFENKNVKPLRLYVRIDKGKTVQEAIAILDSFDQFNICYSEGEIRVK